MWLPYAIPLGEPVSHLEGSHSGGSLDSLLTLFLFSVKVFGLPFWILNPAVVVILHSVLAILMFEETKVAIYQRILVTYICYMCNRKPRN